MVFHILDVPACYSSSPPEESQSVIICIFMTAPLRPTNVASLPLFKNGNHSRILLTIFISKISCLCYTLVSIYLSPLRKTKKRDLKA